MLTNRLRSGCWPLAKVQTALGGLIALGVVLSLTVPVQTGRAAALPACLPAHFAFGLGASPDNSGIAGYMPQMGVPVGLRDARIELALSSH